MRRTYLGSLAMLVVVLWLPVVAQDSASPLPPGAIMVAAPSQQNAASMAAPAPASFNDVMDRVVQREHLFVAQMRHMRPMVETYLQDFKNGKDGNAVPVKDQYFLGRLDMSDGPEDTSFIGQPGFGQRMLNRLTGLYAMHFLPLGFAQMVVLDTDFQKKLLQLHLRAPRVPWRSALPGHRRRTQAEGSGTARFMGRIWVEDQDYNVVRFNGTYSPHPKSDFSCISTAGG